MTSVLQPMDQGIIASFKMKYRSFMMKEKIEAIEYSSTLPEIDILKAWDIKKENGFGSLG